MANPCPSNNFTTIITNSNFRNGLTLLVFTTHQFVTIINMNTSTCMNSEHPISTTTIITNTTNTLLHTDPQEAPNAVHNSAVEQPGEEVP